MTYPPPPLLLWNESNKLYLYITYNQYTNAYMICFAVQSYTRQRDIFTRESSLHTYISHKRKIFYRKRSDIVEF